MPASAHKQREVAERRARVLQLRAAGLTFQQIADECGHATASAAVMDVTRALADRKTVMDGQIRLFAVLEAERLDALERRLQTVITEAARAKDHEKVLKAADRLIRLSGRRSALLGLDIRYAQAAAERPADGIDQLAARRAARRAAG